MCPPDLFAAPVMTYDRRRQSTRGAIAPSSAPVHGSVSPLRTSLEKGEAAMPTPTAMSIETFYGYVYPLQNRRFYLALVFSLLLFPVVAAGLIAGTIVLIVPLIAFSLWMGMRIFFAHMLGNSVLVSAENYPRILAMTREVQANLGYTKPIYVFVFEDGSFNAYMRHLFFRRAIFLNSQLLQNGVSDREVRWVIGRFVGYMRARQQAGFLGWVIRAAQKLLLFNFFILPYERAMVYTGDRLALAEIDGDLTSATSAMQKLLVGRELGYSINPEGHIAQHRSVRGTFFGFLARVGNAFPHTTARYIDLVLFTRAFFPEQYKVFESENPGLPADLTELGLTQQSPSGAARATHAPLGWVCAAVTVVAMTGVGSAGWVAVKHLITPVTESTSFGVDPSTSQPLQTLDAIVPQTVPQPVVQPDAAPIVESVAEPVEPVAADTSTQPTLPPHTHAGPNGQLLPDEGCHWVTNAADDFNVVCD
jgi:hypothetical protein